ncbi:G kinase-anchoring protein 1-like [Lutzomyia longipalpis]|uniref:G kinase-anchoring protein 1-like n=1 Tax=Lutzomyia longipalpis TaxID=7200 RepID=UPI0024835F57|nr:G kinase-anchoring protein 1-like [Lutzomyia longipalpis]
MSFPASSRFSVLQLVGDNQSKKGKKQPESDGGNTNKKAQKPKPKKEREKKPPPDGGKGKKPEPVKEEVSARKQKQLEKKQKKREEHITEKQWSTWQAKDAEYVDGIFEKDLKAAILQSQMEEQMRQKEKPAVPQEEDSAGKKTKKVKKLSLQEFMSQSGEQSSSTEAPDGGRAFKFSEIEDRVKEIIRREQYRMMGCPVNGPETVLKIDDTPTPSPAEEEDKDRQIAALEASVVGLKMELSEWQMKYEGASKLLEEQSKLISVQLANPTTESLLKRIDDLQRQQVELYHEIGSLHVLLEQERSKNQSDGSKIKNGGVKKSVRFSAA